MISHPGKPASEARYQPADVDQQARDLIIQWLGSPPLKQKLWSWQYAQRRNVEAQHVVVTAGDELIGFNGLMPVQVHLQSSEEMSAAWSCDFVVAPAARRKGVGSELKRRLHGLYPLIMALGISDMAVPVHTRLGWHPTASSVAQLTLNRCGWSARGLARRLLQTLRKRLSGLAGGHEAPGPFSVKHLDAAVAAVLGELWQRHSAGWPNAVARTADYLRWRYAECPVACYEALLLGEPHAPQAALIFRRHEWEAGVVDYVGPAHAPALKRALIAACVRECEGSAVISALTSDRELIRAMKAQGFLGRRNLATRFHVMAEPELAAAASGTWFLTAGDSDGEFLAAARLYPQVRVEEWNEAQFLSAETEWTRLLREADAHPIFMSFLWQRLWWEKFGRPSGARLRVLAAYDFEGGLVGLAPFMLAAERIRSGVWVRRIALLGTIWRRGQGMRTEYLSFVIRRGMEAGVVASFLAKLRRDDDWDELVVGDVDIETEFYRALRRFAPTLGYTRNPSPRRDYSYRIHTCGALHDYRRGLSGSARRRLFNMRNRLEREHGPVTLEYAQAADVDAFMDDLNRLHAVRWGRPAFAGAKREFNAAVARALAGRDELRMSRMRVAGEVVSVLLNLRCGREEINLQAGFDERLDRNIPLGYVHLGLALEECFASPTDTLDLLAGEGKHTDYKANLATETRTLTVLQVVRDPFLARGYILRDRRRETPSS